MIHIGFTGSSTIITAIQAKRLKEYLKEYELEDVFAHHGDCIRGDALFHVLGQDLGFQIIIHPPNNSKKRAFCGGKDTIVLPTKDYLIRNQDIVNSISVLIACPKEMTEQLRSGTWSTVRKARKKGIHVIIVYPDGSIG